MRTLQAFSTILRVRSNLMVEALRRYSNWEGSKAHSDAKSLREHSDEKVLRGTLM